MGQGLMNTMIELLGWTVGVGAFGLETILIWSAIAGFGATVIGTVRTSYEWLWTGAGALFGAWLGSEWFAGALALGPVVDGLALVPALICAGVLAAVVDIAVRRMTGGSYRRNPGRVG
jgi:hypothetical protein